MNRKVILSANTSWYIFNFRRNLIQELKRSGWELIVLAPSDKYSSQLMGMGCSFVPVTMSARGLNPFHEIKTLIRYIITLSKIRPRVYLSYTIKPNIYGGIICRVLRIPYIINVSGLGDGFSDHNLIKIVLKKAYFQALANASIIFFQNKENQEQFVMEDIVEPNKTRLLPGSGVDLRFFTRDNLEAFNQVVVFLFSGRLLWKKGIGEFVEAAKLCMARNVNCVFQIVGFPCDDRAVGATLEDLNIWSELPNVFYSGASDDIRSVLRRVDCVVLPSCYKEGTPRSLLEAMAMSLPIITTTLPGCRDLIVDGVTGLVCNPGNPEALARVIRNFCSLSAEDRANMGVAARRLVEHKYDETIVISEYMKAIKHAVQ